MYIYTFYMYMYIYLRSFVYLGEFIEVYQQTFCIQHISDRRVLKLFNIWPGIDLNAYTALHAEPIYI